MNRSIILSLSIFLLAYSESRGQTPTLKVTKDYADTYSGQFGEFTVDSAVLAPNDPTSSVSGPSIINSVCNLNPSNGLAFIWQKASLGTGSFYPLPPGKCMTLSQFFDQYKADHSAPILFTQHSEQKNESVFLPISNPGDGSESQLSTYYGQGSEVSFHITQTLINGEVEYQMIWGTGIPDVVLSLNLPSDIAKDIVGQLSTEGVNPELGVAATFVKSEQSQGPGLPQGVLFLRMKLGQPGTCDFSYREQTGKSTESPILITDDAGHVIVQATYRLTE